MKILAAFLNVFRSTPATKPSTLVRARTQDAAPRRVIHAQVCDSMVRHRDVLLSAEKTKNYRLDPGATWEGAPRPERECPLRVDPSLLGAEPEFAIAFNEQSRKFWTNGNDEPKTETAERTADRAAAARFARAATNATSVRDQADHMNAAARAFWGDAA